MIEIFQYEFMRNALISAVLISIACGIVGTYVVIKRIVFISGGISHASFGGIGLGYLLGINPIIVAIPFSIISAIIIGIVVNKAKIREDSAIGMIWVIGMALGIIFIDLSPGYAPDLFSYLFGSILAVSKQDIFIMILLDFIIVLSVLLFHREFSGISFDEEFSEIVGMPAKAMYFFLLCLISLSIIVLIRAVGIILVIALLTIPVSISMQFVHEVKKIMILSIFIGICFTIIGLLLSYILNLSSGAIIIIALGIAFLFNYIF